MRYREFKIVNEQDIHNPNVNMKDVFETMDMIQEMGLGLRWTDSDDGIVILGALGDPKFNKKLDLCTLNSILQTIQAQTVNPILN